MTEFNPIYLLLLIPMLLAWYSHVKVRKTYQQYDEQPNRGGLNGVEIANSLLGYYQLSGIRIENISGYLTDHYDPQTNVLRLSDRVARGSSVTALGIVAHEVGHAAQDAENYHFMRLRTFLGKRVGLITQWSSIAFIGGWIFGIPVLMAMSGMILLGMFIFSVVTLPVERNASYRALQSLEETGLAAEEERKGVRAVLRAASFTYLTNVVQRLGSFLFLVVMVAVARGILG